MLRVLKLVPVLMIAWTSLGLGQVKSEGRLMRFPDIYKDKIVFSYAGDLWLVSSAGGEARRITSSPGLELFPKFSPVFWIMSLVNSSLRYLTSHLKRFPDGRK